MKRRLEMLARYYGLGSYLRLSNLWLAVTIPNQLRQYRVIVVHQMGKVGSSSVFRSLINAMPKQAIFQTHFLNKERIIRHLKAIPANRVAGHLVTSQFIRKVIEKEFDKKEWKVITLVRDPIARNLSAFFQNIESYFPGFYKEPSGSLDVAKFTARFLNEYPHDVPLTWLDSEIHRVFGIDVFASQFPKNTGYCIYRKNNVELLLLKTESLGDCVHDALREFLSLEKFQLKSANVSKSKVYSDAYLQFINGIELPKSYVGRMYHSKVIKHFYNEDEISLFRKRWLAGHGGTMDYR